MTSKGNNLDKRLTNMSTDKAVWINKIMEADGLKNMAPSAALETKVLNKINNPDPGVVNFSQIKYVVGAVATFVVINAGILVYSSKHETSKPAPEAYLESYNLNLY